MKLICCLILNLYGHNARDSLGLELVSSSFDAMLFYMCVCVGGLFFVLILLAPSAAHVHISAEQMVVQSPEGSDNF